MTLAEKFSKFLRIQMERNGWDVQALIDRVRLPRPSVSRHINARTIPHYSTRTKYAFALGLSPLEFERRWRSVDEPPLRVDPGTDELAPPGSGWVLDNLPEPLNGFWREAVDRYGDEQRAVIAAALAFLKMRDVHRRELLSEIEACENRPVMFTRMVEKYVDQSDAQLAAAIVPSLAPLIPGAEKLRDGGYQVGSVHVALIKKEIVPVSVVDKRGSKEIMADTRKPYLVIDIGIWNHSRREKMEYFPWRGFSNYVTDYVAKIYDEFGNEYPARRLDDDDAGVEMLDQVRAVTRIDPNDGILDRLIFDVPVPQAESLMLVMPGVNIGAGHGIIRFDLKRSEISQRARSSSMTFQSSVQQTFPQTPNQRPRQAAKSDKGRKS